MKFAGSSYFSLTPGVRITQLRLQVGYFYMMNNYRFMILICFAGLSIFPIADFSCDATTSEQIEQQHA